MTSAKRISPSKLREETDRKAFEEASKYYLHIDNFFWLISSFFIGLSVTSILCFVNIIEKIPSNNIYAIVIIVFDVFMILLWTWYCKFLKTCQEQLCFYLDKIYKLEKILKIKIFPEVDEKFNFKTKSKKALSFQELMIKVSAVFIAIFSIKILGIICVSMKSCLVLFPIKLYCIIGVIKVVHFIKDLFVLI